jgi:hypothetical protein
VCLTINFDCCVLPFRGFRRVGSRPQRQVHCMRRGNPFFVQAAAGPRAHYLIAFKKIPKDYQLCCIPFLRREKCSRWGMNKKTHYPFALGRRRKRVFYSDRGGNLTGVFGEWYNDAAVCTLFRVQRVASKCAYNNYYDRPQRPDCCNSKSVRLNKRAACVYLSATSVLWEGFEGMSRDIFLGKELNAMNGIVIYTNLFISFPSLKAFS